MSVISNAAPDNQTTQGQELIDFIQEISCLCTRESLFDAVQNWLLNWLAAGEIAVFLPVPSADHYVSFWKEPAMSTNERLFEEAMRVEEPVFADNDTLRSGATLAVGLRNGGTDIGILVVSSGQSSGFDSAGIALIKILSRQLSIIIANLTAQEVIAEKERDVSVLLSFSKTISIARTRSDLFAAIQDHIRVLIPSLSFAVILCNPESGAYYDFFTGGAPIDPALGQMLLNYAGPDKPWLSPEADILKCDLSGSPFEKGFQEFASIVLSHDGLIFGACYLLGKTAKKEMSAYRNLLLGIADLLSFTIINILAQEEILKKEREKNTLLDIGRDMAKVKTKADLYDLVNNKLKNVLPFDHSSVFEFADDGKTGTLFLADRVLTRAGGKIRRPDLDGTIAVDDFIHQKALHTGKPLIFQLSSLYQINDIPSYISLNYAAGMREMIITPFADSKKTVGFLMIFAERTGQLNSSHLDLIRGLSAQLPIALSNILANEKIEQQILEISRYKQQLEVENSYLREEIQTTHNYSEIVSTSRAMSDIFDMISQVAETQSTVLILGETGTGKELIARAIHNNSLRKGKAMIKVNCATLPANLIESELFGHERGSFTGATEKRLGKFELANNSTIFLDEIGELPLELQVKLLRALQEQEIERIGGRSVIKINVRVIAATNRDLFREIREGNFRSDLFFRLNIFPLTIPPLRDRKDDIPVLAAHFLEKYNTRSPKKIDGFSSRALRELLSYAWPGNVRELEHLIERNILLATGAMIDQLHLSIGPVHGNPTELPGTFKTIEEVERAHIMAVLKSCNGKVAGTGGAAEILKLPVTTIHSKMKRLGINKKYSSKYGL